MRENAMHPQDAFYWMGEINKASAVMVTEQAIVPPALGREICRAIEKVIIDGNKPGAERPGDYLDVEAALIAAGGPDVTRVHSGRSRQDISATFGRLFLRRDLLDSLAALHGARRAILEFARLCPDAIIPAYTWGVQAQPITVGHWLTGYADALTRTAARWHEAYARVNLCPLGSAALGTSSFPVDRPRLAVLLGFDGVCENSFDATQLAQVDVRAEVVATASAAALTVGMLLADLTHQYAQTRPWFTLDPGAQTGVSSIMPQKRNPTGLIRLRTLASQLAGGSSAFAFRAHNVPSGMHDYKLDGPDPTLRNAVSMFGELAALVPALRFDPARALDEVNAEYSTTTELADVLQRDADIPFRAGHHFASELVTFGRANQLRPSEIPFDEAKRLYAQAVSEFSLDTELPISEAVFRASLSPEGMVRASRGMGGPQPDEVQRMLERAQKSVDDDANWLREAEQRLVTGAQTLDATYRSLMS